MSEIEIIKTEQEKNIRKHEEDEVHSNQQINPSIRKQNKGIKNIKSQIVTGFNRGYKSIRNKNKEDNDIIDINMIENENGDDFINSEMMIFNRKYKYCNKEEKEFYQQKVIALDQLGDKKMLFGLENVQ